ncbi:hypothetical protein BKA63DRAFT_256588 [Paraphoma chrysanthemicola]|nr:hypothetical protein BKA63DRAFT_256588 [Paraphoma chrysanthemicola]
MESVKISAAGCEIQLVKNLGFLMITFGASDGATVTWEFQKLEELRQATRSVGTQTITTLPVIIKGMKPAQKPLVSAPAETFLQSRGRKITSIFCEDASGTKWKVTPEGVAKRLRTANDHCDNPSRPLDDQPAAMRTRSRLRLQQIVRMNAATELLPQHLFLKGEIITGTTMLGVLPCGHVCISRNSKKIKFWHNAGSSVDQEIERDNTTRVLFEPDGNEHKLEIMHGDAVVFASRHSSNIHATGSTNEYILTSSRCSSVVFLQPSAPQGHRT